MNCRDTRDDKPTNNYNSICGVFHGDDLRQWGITPGCKNPRATGTAMPSKVCIFCGSQLNGERALEHVIPQGLLDHLGIRESSISQTHFSVDGSARSTRKHGLGSLLAGKICRGCNSGWMSELESSAMQDVIALADAREEVVDLAPQARFALAKWAMKTALVLNLASNFHRQVPPEHYEWLCREEGSLPQRVVVFAQQHHFTVPFYWIQGSSWIIHSKRDVPPKTVVETLQNGSYKIALLFRHLLLLVAYQPMEDLRYVVWRGVHVPLYPPSGSAAFYARDDFEWKDSVKSIVQFHGSLGLVAANECSEAESGDSEVNV
jgi:hypothetical protein